MTPPDPSDGSFWAILLGGGSVLGVAITKGFDYLKARMRQVSGDRRCAESGLDRLVKRLESRLDSTEDEVKKAWQKAEDTASRLAECEKRHANCTAKVSILTAGLNEMRTKFKFPPLEIADE